MRRLVGVRPADVRQLRSGCLVAVSPHSGTDPRHGRVVCRGAPRRV